MPEIVTRERPILFSGPMVRAILDGRKTHTRRVVKPQPEEPFEGPGSYHPALVDRHGEQYPGDPVYGIWGYDGEWATRCPYGQPGDRLWVRETWHRCPHCAGATYRDPDVLFRASDGKFIQSKCAAHGWKPSIHMPRWASRLTLEVTAVRVERLQAISEADVTAEGIAVEWQGIDGPIYGAGERVGFGHNDQADTAIGAFRHLWDSINAKRGHGWATNPWVWVLEFRGLS